MTCHEYTEAYVKQVVHPRDEVPQIYNYDCDRRGPHLVHHAKTWNEGIDVEWTDEDFIVVEVMT